jgi:hypothetical protein
MTLAPWAGFVLGVSAWMASQQVSDYLVPWSCSLGHPTPIVATGAAGAAFAAFGAWVSWRIWRGAGGAQAKPATGSRRFIAALSAGLGGLFLLAILTQTGAAFLFSGCER